MANKIVLKKSSVAAKVPLSTDLDVGEIAVNLVDQKLYSKKTDGTVIVVGNGIGGSGTVTSVGGTGTVNGITLTGAVTTTGNLTLGGTLSGVSLTTQVSGTLPIANGGTNATSAADARTNLDVPTRTGGNASGTWGISVTGNAATATTATTASTLSSLDNRTILPNEQPASTATFGFTSWANNNTSPYADYFSLNSYTDATGGNQNLVAFRKDAIGMRIWQGAWGSASAYSTFKDVAFTDGTNATGTWGISVSGNAATATTATTANALNSANNYTVSNLTATGSLLVGSGGTYAAGSLYSDGNWGMIFRAKQASPAMAEFMWTNSAGTELFRYNGTAFTTNITGSSASCTGNAATITGQANSATITAATAATANTIALRDGSGAITAGYIYGSYFNSTAGNGENPTIGQFWTQSTGDNFVRKSTPSHVVSQLGLVSNYGTSYYQVNTWLQLNGSYGLYCPSINGAHFYPNTSSTYGEWATQGSKNSYSGTYLVHSGVNGMMYDGGGSGGVYREASGRWYWYYNLGNDCMGIGTSGTDSGYSLYLSKGVRGFSTNYTTGVTYSATYYDYNDATYYVDPASTSVMKTINQNGSHNLTFAATSGNWPQQVINSVDRGTLYQQTSGSSIPLYFLVNNGGTVSGYVICSGGSTSYVTSSDYRMKENVQDLDKDAALAKIMAVKPVTFNWLPIHGGESDVGFIAHILQETAPECVDGEKDRTHPDGKIFPQAVDRSMLVPSICAAMQKQQQLIEQLIAEVALLKGN